MTSRRWAGVLAALACSGAAAAGAAPPAPWIGGWEFPPMSFLPSPAPGAATENPPDFDNVTVRQIVRVAQSTEWFRIRLSNEFGAAPMRVGAVHAALAAADGSLLAGSDHVIEFSGRGAFSIPAAAPLLSDPVRWRVPALATVAVSIYLPADTPPPAHRVWEYVSSPGDYSGAVAMPGAELRRTGALVSQVEVVSTGARWTVVALGDSITEGFGSTVNEFRDWPDRLAERLSHDRRTRAWSVVNAGINSNRLLHDGPGMGALARFDRDVLSVPSAALVVVAEGINDIGYSHTVPVEAVSADDIVAAYRQLIARAHARGVGIVGCTLSPFAGSHYFTAQGEQIRQDVNRWIRTAGEFDGIVDFDAVLRDPANPAEVNSRLQRGDHLHPNDAGYAALADAVDLGVLLNAFQHVNRTTR